MCASSEEKIDSNFMEPLLLNKYDHAYHSEHECRPHILQFNKYGYHQQHRASYELNTFLNQSTKKYQINHTLESSCHNSKDRVPKSSVNRNSLLPNVMDVVEVDNSQSKFDVLSMKSRSQEKLRFEDTLPNTCIFVNNESLSDEDNELEPLILSCSLQSLPNISNLTECNETAEIQIKKNMLKPSIKHSEADPEAKLKELSSNFGNEFLPVYQSKRYAINNYIYVEGYSKIDNNENKVVACHCGATDMNSLKNEETQVNENSKCYITLEIKMDDVNSEGKVERLKDNSYSKSEKSSQTYFDDNDLNNQEWKNNSEQMSVPKNKQKQKGKERLLNNDEIRTVQRIVPMQQNFLFQTINSTFTKLYDVVKMGTEFCNSYRDEDTTWPNISKTKQRSIESTDTVPEPLLQMDHRDSSPLVSQSMKERSKSSSTSSTTSKLKAISLDVSRRKDNKETYKTFSEHLNEVKIPIQTFEIYEATGENNNFNNNTIVVSSNAKEICEGTASRSSVLSFNNSIPINRPSKLNDSKNRHHEYSRSQEISMEKLNRILILNSDTSNIDSESSLSLFKREPKDKPNRLVKRKRIDSRMVDKAIDNCEKDPLLKNVKNNYVMQNELNENHNTVVNTKRINKMSNDKCEIAQKENLECVNCDVKPLVFHSVMPRYFIPEINMNTVKKKKYECWIECSSMGTEKEIVLQSNSLVLSTGEPAVLFNQCGFPLTDFKGRKLKNNLGTEMLPVNSMNELMASDLLVYDCFNKSVNEKDFNPIKGIYLQGKNEIQIIDDNNKPARLYNCLGYPLNDEDGVLLYDSLGNLLVVLDSTGTPICCCNSESIFVQDGALWVLVKNNYNIIHYRKPNLQRNSVELLNLGQNGDYRMHQGDFNEPTNFNSNINHKECTTLSSCNSSKSAERIGGDTFNKQEISRHSIGLKEENQRNKTCDSAWGKYYKPANDICFKYGTKISYNSNPCESTISKLIDHSVFSLNSKPYKPLLSPYRGLDTIYQKPMGIYKCSEDYLFRSTLDETEKELTIMKDKVVDFNDFEYTYFPYNHHNILHSEPISQKIFRNKLDAWSLRMRKPLS